MRTRNSALALWVAFLAMGCVEEPGNDEASEAWELEYREFGLGEGACAPKFGRTYILDTLEIRDPGQGVDMNGDGYPDNHLAFLAPIVNAGWTQAFQEGSAIFLIDFLGLARDTEPGIAFYIALDADRPADADNNYSGAGNFEVLPDALDVNCQPTSGFEAVELTDDGRIVADTSRWRFVDPWTGTIEMTDAHAEASFSEDGEVVEAEMGAVWTLCGLSHSLIAGDTQGTMLEMMVSSFQVQPDIDRDGDGVEQVYKEGTSYRCIDGDGTEILGPSCACDPRIVDGYSASFYFHAIPANIVGVSGE